MVIAVNISMCSIFIRDMIALHRPRVLSLFLPAVLRRLIRTQYFSLADDEGSLAAEMLLWTPDQSIVLRCFVWDQMKTKLCCGGQLHCWVFWIFFHVPLHWWFPTACQWSTASLQHSHSPKCNCRGRWELGNCLRCFSFDFKMKLEKQNAV